MNKFDGRIDALVKKTHNFVSNEDFCLLREYFQRRYDEEEKPDDFEIKLKEIETLEREYGRTQSSDVEQQIRELIGSSTVIRLKLLLPWATESCDRYPRGIWVPKWQSFDIAKLVKDARAYFAAKR